MRFVANYNSAGISHKDERLESWKRFFCVSLGLTSHQSHSADSFLIQVATKVGHQLQHAQQQIPVENELISMYQLETI